MRERLPNRRRSVNFDFVLNNTRHTGTIGFYDDGRPGEIFLDAYKTGTDLQAIMRDTAIMTSVMLQTGCSVDEIRSFITKSADGLPAQAVDALFEGALFEGALA